MPASLFPLAQLSAAALCAAGATVALLFAPVASAVPECIQTGITTTQCQRPGNAQISTSPPIINSYPSGWPWWGGSSIGISIGGLFG